MEFTLLVTQECNLACSYCYISKKPVRMSVDTAEKVVGFFFANASIEEENRIGFFGGEPLLEFELMKKIVSMIQNHPRYHEIKVRFKVTSNGTIFTDEIADFFLEHQISYCISCDGDKQTHDSFRRFKDGSGSSETVSATIKKAAELLPALQVNTVLSLDTLRFLPNTIRYLMSCGLKLMYVNTDYTAEWSQKDVVVLESALDEIAEIYIDSYRQNAPVFISVIDEKISVILRGGYSPGEKCHMGMKEMAFTPEGNIFPCERIVYDGASDSSLCIGNVDTGIDLNRLSCHMMDGNETNSECLNCSIRNYCIHWCGCSNFHATGYYNRVGAFLCAGQKAALSVAFRVLETLEKEMPAVFTFHKVGMPTANAQKLFF